MDAGGERQAKHLSLPLQIFVVKKVEKRKQIYQILI
jgi:hypothetical protein